MRLQEGQEQLVSLAMDLKDAFMWTPASSLLTRRTDVTRCDVTQCDVTQCDVTRCDVTQCDVTQCDVTQYDVHSVT